MGARLMPHLLIAGKIHDEGIRLVESARSFTYDYVTEISHDSYAPLLAKADGLVIRTQPLPASTIATAPALKIVSRHGVGYDAVDVPALNARGIPLAIVGDVNSRPVAEHAMMMMMALAKKMRRYDDATRHGPWEYRNRFEAIELHGKNLLIIGYGRIGRHVAKMAEGFGMAISAYDPFQTAETIRAGGVEPANDLHDALSKADFVTLHVPMTDKKAVIGKDELARMKKSAIIVNTARGGLIDEKALDEALGAGQIGGAGIDVFVEEPPPANHPLFRHETALLSPHSASLTAESAIRMAVMSVKNAIDYFEKRLDPALVVNRAHLSAEALAHVHHLS
jgi:D-3-phosphoglycerate dehydrogenase / 2-oxoglutarate reductase